MATADFRKRSTGRLPQDRQVSNVYSNAVFGMESFRDELVHF